MQQKKFLGLMVALFVLMTASMATAMVELTGTVGNQTIHDDVTIPVSATATLEGTIIHGNVFVQGSARLYANRAEIHGYIHSYMSRLVSLNLQTFVEGDIIGKYTRSIRLTDGTMVGGKIQLEESNAPTNVDALLVSLSMVEGDVKVVKSVGRLRVLMSRVRGNLHLEENYSGPYQILYSKIIKDLHFIENRGRGTISYNQVNGNLESDDNVPDPIVKSNIVNGDVDID